MGEHFNKGNRFALKEPQDKASEVITKRMTPACKKLWREQAAAEGLTLSHWMQVHLDAVCAAAKEGNKS